MKPNRPAIARDTRLLLAIIAISVAMLWVLARIRFPDRAPTPNPVPPVLAQLTPPSAFDDIATTVAQLEPRLQPWVLPLDVDRLVSGRPAARTTVSAFRYRDDVALTFVQPQTLDQDGAEPAFVGAAPAGHDWATGLAVVRVTGDPAPAPTTWEPRRLAVPRFLIAVRALHTGAVLRPVYIGSLRQVGSPLWPRAIWTVPPPADVEPGTLLFTPEGAVAGLAIARDGAAAIVPADVAIEMADRLVRDGSKRRGWIGVDVQPLTPSIAAATDASTGLIVSWVAADGPGAGQLSVADVIEAADGDPVGTLEGWRAHAGRLAEQQAIVLRVRRGDAVRDVQLVAVAPPPPASTRPLGLTLRTRRSAGGCRGRPTRGPTARCPGTRRARRAW